MKRRAGKHRTPDGCRSTAESVELIRLQRAGLIAGHDDRPTIELERIHR